ncbi:hypothetical protein GX586_09085 [bacterium]|nr:hypothetical protein [bacterium]
MKKNGTNGRNGRNGAGARPAKKGIALTSYKLVFLAGIIVAAVAARYLLHAQRQTEMTRAGYRLNQVKREITMAKNMNANLRSELEKLRQPERVQAQLRQYGIDLVIPKVERIVRLKLDGAPRGGQQQEGGKTLGTLLVSTRDEE